MLPDWQLAYEAEKKMRPITEIAKNLDLEPEELLPYGRFIAKIEDQLVLQRLKDRSNGKYIDVTAITPTPLGEGKSTTTIGLLQAMSKRGCKVSAAIRQPSAGPTMGIKGSSAGGGYAQCIPLTPYSLNFTGDIHAVTAAHNLAMTALTARMQHERNNDDENLVRLSAMQRLNIDPTRVTMGWAIDFCCQALRNIIIGIEANGRNDGFMMRSHFVITAASEVMSILSLARDFQDLRQRLAKIVLAYDRSGKAITTKDLEVDGAMAAWLLEAAKPNLIQSMEGQPVFVHSGPFGNIALGQSSIIADRLALKLSDWHITESGFGSEIGYEKFWNVKCRISGLIPDAAVIVATIRALKFHGGAPSIKPGQSLPEAYQQNNPQLVENGLANLKRHIEIVQRSGASPVVCINAFVSDTKEEIAVIKDFCQSLKVRVALSEHWAKGGAGALELADAVMDAANSKNNFDFLYPNTLPFAERIESIAKNVYGASGIEWTNQAKTKLADLQKRDDTAELNICMVKTQYSLSDDPKLQGAPQDWTLHIRDILFFAGAGLVVPVAGDISLMPGTGSKPAFRNVDVQDGMVTGLF